MTKRKDHEAEFAIDLAYFCKQTHSLPGPGGVLQQDVIHMRWLRAGFIAINEFEAAEIKKQQR